MKVDPRYKGGLRPFTETRQKLKELRKESREYLTEGWSHLWKTGLAFCVMFTLYSIGLTFVIYVGYIVGVYGLVSLWCIAKGAFLYFKANALEEKLERHGE